MSKLSEQKTIIGQRAAGFFLHPTMLMDEVHPQGIGVLGGSLIEFLQWIKAAGGSYWQVLPLVPTLFDYGNSLYSSPSSFALNPLLIDLSQVPGELDLKELEVLGQDGWIDFEALIPLKFALLCSSFEEWLKVSSSGDQAFKTFCESNADWLEDYSLYFAILDSKENHLWYEWEADLKLRMPEALEGFRQGFGKSILFYKWLQYVADLQWSKIRKAARELGIKIIGDMPIYVENLGDVWADPSNWLLDENCLPLEQAGVPPDYFSSTGQRWGNPIYNWERHRQTSFEWWKRRFKRQLDLCDLVRWDHFRALHQYWSIPQGETVAIKGDWVDCPGDLLLGSLSEIWCPLPVVAENLGVITPEVEDLRDQFLLAGMGLLMFAFDGNPENPHLPWKIKPNTLATPGTHDSEPLVCWWAGQTPESSDYISSMLRDYGGASDSIPLKLIKATYGCAANLVMTRAADALGLGEAGMLNRPGEADGNWRVYLRARKKTYESIS